MADSFRFDEYQDSFSASFAPDSTGSVWEEIAKGDPGKGLEFSGLVADASELPQDVELYTMYLVGAEAPYTIYMLNVTGWVDLGTYRGPRGYTGVTPNLGIGTVTTGDPGTPAAASITGTPEEPLLNLTIPRGYDGDDYVLTQQDKEEIADIVSEEVLLHITGTVSSNSLYINDSRITSDMRVLECVWGTPANVTSDISWETSDGDITFSNGFSGQTTVDLILGKTN